LQKKFKIQKKAKEHKKKLRRDAKKNPQMRTKLTKDPGIPNLWHFKEQLLQKMSTEKREQIEEKKKSELSRLNTGEKKTII